MHCAGPDQANTHTFVSTSPTVGIELRTSSRGTLGGAALRFISFVFFAVGVLWFLLPLIICFVFFLSSFSLPFVFYMFPGCDMANLVLTIVIIIEFLTSHLWLGNIHLSWDVVINRTRISRNPKVHYRTHKRPPTVSILGPPNPVHIPTSHLLEIRPNIIHPSTPRSPQWSFPPVSPSRPYTPPSPHPYGPHAQSISFFSILSPA